MTIFVITTVGRQTEGEMISVRFEKAFSDRVKAENYVKQLTKNYVENVPTPNGVIQFVCERGIHEVDLDSDAL